MTILPESKSPPTPTALLDKINEVRKALQNVIRGKTDVIDTVLIALLAEGSLLLEDVPGVGKTTLAKSIARLIDLEFHRIQCTPDLLPADMLGSNIFKPSSGTFEFRAGPIFSNLLIADEINRASPRTQSALLEAMAESQVTIDAKRYVLKRPFLVIATQNPSGFEGTFPLPESQLDRFLMRLSMEYPDRESEVELLLEQAASDPSSALQPVMTADELTALQTFVRKVKVDRKAAMYIVEIAAATRTDSRLRVGVSPRGSKMLLRATQARAVLLGRNYVLPDDIQNLASSVLSHRVSTRNVTSTSAETTQIIADLINTIKVPV
ncbi:ATPase family associated with various cellular activities (AAA) [Novipirellula galeiformis]|uniref:ATPase family associated with various cellular activities (AAA) n=1 Tax=Novipirellula galeiformis TaxID=2528004 RepID=A0A5C6CI80_9BACT|nr:MoxR family ATPase [Novipirellula galeiformis]TWU23204.1 ATPase family associated with various cellular activities (AAA) [Novipirellula galeiformis]